MIDYSKILSERVQAVKPSGIRKFFDLASTMMSFRLALVNLILKHRGRYAAQALLRWKKDELSILQTGACSSFVMRLQDWRCADMTCFMTRMTRSS